MGANGLGVAQLAVTPLSPAGERVAAALPAELADTPVELVPDPERQAGRGYYRDLCFKLNVEVGERARSGEAAHSARAAWAEVGDGGFTDWTARLTASGKERLLISGVGIDRVIGLASGRAG
jgi:hypothetical protein